MLALQRRQLEVSQLPLRWEWKLAPGCYELLLAPFPEGARLELICAGTRVPPRRSDARQGEVRWRICVPAGGAWHFELRGRLPVVRASLSIRNVPLDPPEPLPSLPPRGVRLGEMFDDPHTMRATLEELLLQGVVFALGDADRLAQGRVREMLEELGLLALGDERYSRMIFRPGEKVPFGAWSGWSFDDVCSPTGGRSNIPWPVHVTTSGLLSLKHLVWADVGELWYHPGGDSTSSPTNGFLLARLRGEGIGEAFLAECPVNAHRGKWTVALPHADTIGVAWLRWPSGSAPTTPTHMQAGGWADGMPIPEWFAGSLYMPVLPVDDPRTPTLIRGRGRKPPEEALFFPTQLRCERLWSIAIGPGRRRWPEGVAPLDGYRQPSRTKDVLIGVRLQRHSGETHLLVAQVEARGKAPLQWYVSAGNVTYQGAQMLSPGVSRIVIPVQRVSPQSDVLIKASREAVRMRALEAFRLPIRVVSGASGPHWVETKITARLRTNAQRWTVRMMRGQPWAEMSIIPQDTAPARLMLDAPQYDRLLVNGKSIAGTTSVTRKVKLIVLKDSAGVYPNLSIIPREQGTKWTIRQVGNTLTLESMPGAPHRCVVLVGKLDRWGGADAIRWAAKGAIRPVTPWPNAPVVLENAERKAMMALAKVPFARSGPYWVCEGNWWRHADAQVLSEGSSSCALVPVHIAAHGTVALYQGHYLHECVRPLPGSQPVLLLGEISPDTVAVKKRGEPPPFDVPLGVEFRHAFVGVICNGQPWHVHDGKRVWLPAGKGICRIQVMPIGEPTPTVVEPSVGICSTRWTGARLTVRLEEVPPGSDRPLTVRYPHTAMRWAGIEGGSGESIGPGILQLKPEARIVHIRFLPRGRAG